MCDQPEPSPSEQSSAFSEFIKTVVQDVLDGVMPILQNYQATIDDFAARLDRVESVVFAQQAKIKAMESSIKQLRSENGLVRVELEKLQYHADLRQSKQAAGNICAFPVKKPPESAGNPGDSEKLLETLASEVPGVRCAIKPFKSGGFKISFHSGSSFTAQQGAEKAIESAPAFLAKHGLAVTRDLPVSLRKARQKVQIFLTELRQTPRFSNLKIELKHGHVKVNNKALGPEYLWPNAISVGRDKFLELIGLSEFCTCSNWEKGLWHDDLVQLNLKYFAGSVQEL